MKHAGDVPTREDVLGLNVGDLAPNCFGEMRAVTEIFGSGINVSGKAFVCYYAEFGPNSTMSHSLVEGEKVSIV
jgi:hypothetical protein